MPESRKGRLVSVGRTVYSTAMRIIGTVLLAAGIVMALMGLVWMGQGSGYFPYPASSFMIDERVWIYYGLMMLVAGLVVVFLARRLIRGS